MLFDLEFMLMLSILAAATPLELVIPGENAVLLE
jgi:hypothetical protein